MSRFTEALREIGVYNEHGFFAGEVCIAYAPQQTGRWSQSAKWQVYKGDLKTDPDSHWTDNYRKTFVVYGRDEKALQLETAKVWAGAKYGITEWARSPFGGWGDAEFVKARTRELKAQTAARNTQQQTEET